MDGVIPGGQERIKERNNSEDDPVQPPVPRRVGDYIAGLKQPYGPHAAGFRGPLR
eukprot:CAMPEP_0183291426 /NCGR_PEP_ID=MMETSP0160_2-20130417/856_1 /TAXON_ID=2839 ORGANISM="Odontella Sinensis, Strain Grunow 1884" /NCGR_SAMPLE_ID=MMETSP0160_2 /ASSEMBLY_ACC=CAM_ASM_000250 /LENGTH=54 /DNA_ID=CAMNT_0025452231 /DNA_START=222 /DNA_END=383 /DNA_ORIENTATION=+